MPSRDFVLLRPRNGEKNEANRVAGTRVGEERERERGEKRVEGWREGSRRSYTQLARERSIPWKEIKS